MTKTRSMCQERQSQSAGFSLIELLVVVGIIIVMVAIALPAIGQYIRNYKIASATQELAGELQTARNKAIAKNVNLGVIFAVLNSTQYQWVVEDDTAPSPPGNNHPWYTVLTEGGGSFSNLTGDPLQSGPVRTLPASIEFDTNPANCKWPTAGPAASTWGVRFGRLGTPCDFKANPLNANCQSPPATGVPTQNFIGFPVGGGTGTICLWEKATGIRRAVTIGIGGRIQAQP